MMQFCLGLSCGSEARPRPSKKVYSWLKRGENVVRHLEILASLPRLCGKLEKNFAIQKKKKTWPLVSSFPTGFGLCMYVLLHVKMSVLKVVVKICVNKFFNCMRNYFRTVSVYGLSRDLLCNPKLRLFLCHTNSLLGKKKEK